LKIETAKSNKNKADGAQVVSSTGQYACLQNREVTNKNFQVIEASNLK